MQAQQALHLLPDLRVVGRLAGHELRAIGFVDLERRDEDVANGLPLRRYHD